MKISKANLINGSESIKLVLQPRSLFIDNDKYVHSVNVDAIYSSNCNLQLMDMVSSDCTVQDSNNYGSLFNAIALMLKN